LTKILVGVGLVRLGSIIDELGNLADYLGPAMGDGPAASAFALAVVVYFVVTGFLVAYLWTRCASRTFSRERRPTCSSATSTLASMT
jgi:hypothetical protein